MPPIDQNRPLGLFGLSDRSSEHPHANNKRASILYPASSASDYFAFTHHYHPTNQQTKCYGFANSTSCRRPAKHKRPQRTHTDTHHIKCLLLWRNNTTSGSSAHSQIIQTPQTTHSHLLAAHFFALYSLDVTRRNQYFPQPERLWRIIVSETCMSSSRHIFRSYFG